MSRPDYLESLLPPVIELAKKASEAVMNIYANEDFGVTTKSDNSPLTKADLAAHNIILDGLKAIDSELPVLSEESKKIPYEERKLWKKYWLVDPLDGTKEFIKRTGEFTINIALIEEGTPILGVVHAPVFDATYFACSGFGAFKQIGDGSRVKISAGDYRNGKLKIVISRSHVGEMVERMLSNISEDYEAVNRGSSLKLCLVAEGGAHLYPRLWPTSEWDTAASQCVVVEAGGAVTDLDGNPLIYNKPDLLNPSFIVCGKPPYPWKDLIV